MVAMRDTCGGYKPEGRHRRSHRSAVVLIPPQAVWGPIQQIRKTRDRQIRRWMPHITLLYPFYEGVDRESVRPVLSEACQRVQPSEVTLSQFGHFRHRPRNSDPTGALGPHTVWVSPEPLSTLQILHEALMAACPDCVETGRHAGGFTPHLTVGQVRGVEPSNSLLRTLQNGWSPITFRADRISVIARGEPPEDVFHVLWQIALGSGEITEGDGLEAQAC